MKFRFNHSAQDDVGGKKEASAAGKIVPTLFFLVFFGVGMFFEIFLIREIIRNIVSRTWPKVSCIILESAISDDAGQNSPYRFTVKYQYVYEDKTLQSEKVQFEKSKFSDYQKAQALADAYPVGSEHMCFVNPQNPSEAILRHSSSGLACFIVIPTIFVFIGGVGLYGTWFYRTKKTPDGHAVRKPKGRIKKGRLGLILFGFIFFAAGAGVSFPLLVRPLWNSYMARNWIERPCKIISARVRSHDSDDGTTYSVDILYEYIFEDRTFRSNCYDFISGSSSGYDGKQTIVERYRAMENPVCYVDPDNPSSAVLVRTLTKRNFIGLFPLIFVAVGLAVMIGGIRSVFCNRNGDSDLSWLPKTQSGTDRPSDRQSQYSSDYLSGGQGSIVLSPQNPPVKGLIFAFVFCAFWNGVISIFVVQVISGFRSGRSEWCLAIFLIPFVVVGAGTITWVIYQFLAMFNPRVALTISPGNLYPGSEGQLEWAVQGRAGRIRSFSIKLIGREEATYRKGTNTRTDKKTFYEKELIRTEQLTEISDGRVRFSIHPDSMHSFEAEHNKIVWLIEIHGDIARWPDVSQEYKLTILPKAIA